MLTPPKLADNRIIARLYQSYGLRIDQVRFLPLGADVNTAVYRVDASDGTAYLLKLRLGDFNETAVSVPDWLYRQGIRRVMAPIPTTTRRLWVHAHGYDWLLYPFVVGTNGFEAAFSRGHWMVLGQTLAAVHAAMLPTALGERMPREDYSPVWRNRVRMYQQRAERHAYDDPIAAGLAAFWIGKRHEIHTIVERAERLARVLRQSELPCVVCHADIHAGNVLVGAHDELAIVDWDTLILAPKERDLMFVGGGIGGVWATVQETALFYQGYGPTTIDPVALSYYRYERIVADLAAYGDQIFEMHGSSGDRAQGLQQVMEQFLPRSVVEIAHQTYQRLR